MSNVQNITERDIINILFQYIPVIKNLYREPIKIFEVICKHRKQVILTQTPRQTITGKIYHFDFTVIDKMRELFVGIEVMKMNTGKSDISYRVNRLLINHKFNVEKEIILLALGGGYSADKEAIIHLNNVIKEENLPITIMHSMDEFINHFKQIYE